MSTLASASAAAAAAVSSDDITVIDHLYARYLLCLQTLSTCEAGVMALTVRADTVCRVCDEYVSRCALTFNDWEIKTSRSLKSFVDDESLKNLTCLLSLLNCILPHDECAALARLHAARPTLFVNLLTLCKHYLSLFGEMRRERSASSSLSFTDHPYWASIDLAKSNMQDLFSLLTYLTHTSDSLPLHQLVKDCMHLLDD